VTRREKGRATEKEKKGLVRNISKVAVSISAVGEKEGLKTKDLSVDRQRALTAEA